MEEARVPRTHPHLPPDRLPPNRLHSLVQLIDEACCDDPGNLLCWVVPGDVEVELRLLRLDGTHPLDVLEACAAPPGCTALVVRATARARHLDSAGQPEPGAGEPVALTLGVDRAGHEIALLRRDGGVEALPGPVAGLVVDACRSALARSGYS
jgi:hypothetical protein